MTLTSAAPILTTPRLVLSAHTTADFPDDLALWTDPVVTRFIGGRPSAPDEVWARLLRYAGLWALLGYGYWAIRDRADGRFLGEAGLADFHRAIDPPLGDTPEAGWILRPEAQGRGLAVEAMTAILDWAQETAGLPRTVCIIAPQNAPSLALAARLGYRQRVETTFRDQPTIILDRG